MTKRKPRKPKGPFWGAKLKCLSCGAVIQSAHVHDFVCCKCPPGHGISIDGGAEYCRFGKASPDTPWEVVDPGNYRSDC